jgi:hypothetical protein
MLADYSQGSRAWYNINAASIATLHTGYLPSLC